MTTYRGYIIYEDTYGYLYYLPDEEENARMALTLQLAKDLIDEIWETEWI